MKSWLKRVLLWGGLVIVTTIAATAIGLWAYASTIGQNIDERMAQLRATRVSQFYALYPPFRLKQRFTFPELSSYLFDQGYEEKRNPDGILPGEYFMARDKGIVVVTLRRRPFAGAGHPLDELRARLDFEEQAGVLTLQSMTRLENNEPLQELEGSPKKIASYFAGRLRTQNAVAISDIPVSMRTAVMAIEDVHFLEHSGVSLRSTLRAFWKDIKAKKFVEGGSTLTQQLMKNLFFSHEKKVSRKFKEALYAFLTESRHSKEEILEAYLNEIYLGQWGTHEIHGVSEGAQIYFNRPITQLNLAQSAMLAAIIQAPNNTDPHKAPEKLLKRRNVVLKKMLDAEFILPDEYQMALEEPLGVVPRDRSLNDVDYFMDLVMEQLPPDVRNRLDKDALTIYTTLNPYLQATAAKALNANLDRLRKLSPKIREKEKKGKHLESALIALDVKECNVLAIQGGHSYRLTQFNRVLQGKRQPGSLFKPFVILTAFDKSTPSDPVTAVTEIEDAPFEWKYEKQVWKPKNYEPGFQGLVTVRETLEHSINTSTARLTQKIGVPPIIETLTKAGIRTALPGVPSIALGSADVTPFELADAYASLAKLGKGCKLRSFLQIFDENRNHVFDVAKEERDALPPVPTFQTVNVMKGVFTHGTARAALSSGLPLQVYAGKTGTTNEAKDAWFAGFSPDLLVLVWVGYDEEEKVGLTGATAALPLWVDFVKSAQPFVPTDDFVKPDGVDPFEVDEKSRALATPRCPEKQVEYFVKGTEPKVTCPLHP